MRWLKLLDPPLAVVAEPVVLTEDVVEAEEQAASTRANKQAEAGFAETALLCRIPVPRSSVKG